MKKRLSPFLQLLCTTLPLLKERKILKIKVVDVTDSGDVDEYLMSSKIENAGQAEFKVFISQAHI